jgi:hypothetical protein
MVIERESKLGRLHRRMAVAGGGKGIDLNPLLAFFGVRQLSRACSGDFLPARVLSERWRKRRREKVK